MGDTSSIHILETSTRGKSQSHHRAVYLIRPELTRILNIYGRMVSAGEWHDYAIDHLEDMAIFSIFKRASEKPLYRVIKEPSLSNKQGLWRIMGQHDQVLKRGKQLDQLLRYFDRYLLKAIP